MWYINRMENDDYYENPFGYDETFEGYMEQDYPFEDYMEQDYEPCEPDNWADADALSSAGWGTDEDYGCFGDDYGDYGCDY